jgi:hypothetical protein
MARKIITELATGLTFKGNHPLTAKALATKRAQMEKYDAYLMGTFAKNLKPVLDKIDNRADKTDDLIVGLGNLMLGHVDMGKMSRVDEKAALRLQRMVIANRNAQLDAAAKAEREAKKAAKKGSKNAAVAFAEAVSSGAATSSAPPAEGEIYAALESDLGVDDPLHAQIESFNRKKLGNNLKVKYFKDLMLKDGPSTPFLDWVQSKWPNLHEEALNATMAEIGFE